MILKLPIYENKEVVKTYTTNSIDFSFGVIVEVDVAVAADEVGGGGVRITIDDGFVVAEQKLRLGG